MKNDVFHLAEAATSINTDPAAVFHKSSRATRNEG